MAKSRCTGFVSYAHADAPLVERFLQLMTPRCASLREIELDAWSDHRILAGERWESEIAAAIAAADFGLVCITPSLLASSYVAAVELPALLAAGTVVPAALEPVDFARSDLRGLEALQIFHYRPPASGRGRAFSECSGVNRGRFCNALVAQLADRLLATAAGGR